jgi:hypothetical protein
MSKETFDKNLLNETEKFSNQNLNRKADLQLIVDNCIANNLYKEFEDLAFTGKYIEGLKRVLNKGADFQEIDNLDYVKKDLTSNMEKIPEQIRLTLTESDKSTQEYFESTYLTLTPDNFRNLNELLKDLELIKKYLNFLKRKEK